MSSIHLIKIVTQILLPPGLFVLFLSVSAYYFYKKGIKSAGYVNTLIAALLYVASIDPSQDYLYKKLEDGLTFNARPDGDVIIVLGGGIYENSPDINGNSVPSDVALARIVMAYRLYKSMKVPIIVTGGKVTNTDTTEADLSKRFLMEFGVPERDIIIENNSRTTEENAKYSRDILKRMGFKKPVLVTSAYHMKRAILCFELYNINVVPAPCSFRAINKSEYKIHNYFPGPSNPFEPLKELLGIGYIKIRLMIR